MSERFHGKGNGTWEGYHDGEEFNEKDIIDIKLKPAYGIDNGSSYYIAVSLKDGREICPDYTVHGNRKNAESEMKLWKDRLSFNSTQNSTGGEKPTDSPMTAAKVLEWFSKADCHMLAEVVDDVLGQFEAKGIITRITAYEATKKAPKPVETEWINLCRIIQTKNDGTKEVVYEENLKAETPFDTDPDLKEQTEAILKKYALGHDGRYIAVIEEICRVKEDES